MRRSVTLVVFKLDMNKIKDKLCVIYKYRVMLLTKTCYYYVLNTIIVINNTNIKICTSKSSEDDGLFEN